MKKIITMVATICMFHVNSAQKTLQEDELKFQTGLIILNDAGQGFGGAFEYQLTQKFSIGVGFEAYVNAKSSYFLYQRTTFFIDDYIELNEKYDVYTGLDIGLYSGKTRAQPRAGIRYHVSESLAIYLEAGIRTSAGIVFNFQ